MKTFEAPEEKSFIKQSEKRRNAGNQDFFPFPATFPTHSSERQMFYVFCNPSDIDKAKILWSGKAVRVQCN